MKADRWSTTIARPKATVKAKAAWRKSVNAHIEGLKLKANAKATYEALVTAFDEADHATNSWQLTSTLNIAEGTLYAAITVLHRAGFLTRITSSRSHFYVASV